MAEKKGRGCSCECRACDAGFCDGRCIIKKGVMYSMYFAVCDNLYIGETDRPVIHRPWTSGLPGEVTMLTTENLQHRPISHHFAGHRFSGGYPLHYPQGD